MKFLNLHLNESIYNSKLDLYKKYYTTHLIKDLNKVVYLKPEPIDESANETIFIVPMSESDKLTLQFWDNTGEGTIDWGDGTKEQLKPHVYNTETGHANDYPTHIYTSNGFFTIILKGDNVTSHWIYIDDKGKEYTALDGYTENKTHNIQKAFPLQMSDAIQVGSHVKSCVSLFAERDVARLHENLFKYCSHIKSFKYCFSGTSNMTELPNNLFSNCTSATDFNRCFINSGINHIPNNLFKNCTNVESFFCCFNYCVNLQNIPEELFSNCTKATNFNGCFTGCNLTSVPGNLFTNNINAENFGDCFAECYNLSTIGDNLFAHNKNVTNFSYCFLGCPISHSYNCTPEGEPKLWERAGLPGYPSNIDGDSFADGGVFGNTVPIDWGGTMA